MESTHAYLFSLVVATLNRFEELEKLFESLVHQTIDLKKFELVVVDQNDNDLILPLIEKYSTVLLIHYIKISRKSSTFSRNIGIRAAKGEYIAFPDDDCVYYEDTLEVAVAEIKKCHYPDMIIGKLFNRDTREYIFKKTSSKIQKINYCNFYNVVSAVTIFMKKSDIIFDEQFGIGERYYAHEDGDLILMHLKEGKKVIYSPSIDIYHPPYNNQNMSNEKSYKYGYGVGAVCRKYRSLPLIYLLVKILSYQIIVMFKSIITFNKKEFSRRFQSFRGGVIGYIQYTEK